MTQAIDSIHERILQGLQQELAGLALPGIVDVIAETNISPATLQYPCIDVVLEDESEEEGEGCYGQIDVIYPVKVVILDSNDDNWEEMRPVYLGWRMACMNHLRQLASLPGVDECYDIQLRTQLVFLRQREEYQYVVSGFTARVFTRTPRKADTQ